MDKRTAKRHALVLIGALTCATGSHAADMMLHVAGGYGDLVFDRGPFDRNVAAYASGTAEATTKNRGLDTRLSVTYQLNKHFALDAGYMQSAQARYSADLTGGAKASGTVSVEGITLAGLGLYPVSKSLTLFARGGAMYGLTKAKLDGGDIAPVSAADYRFAPQWGLGLDYALDKVFSLRTELEFVKGLGDPDRTGKVDRTTFWIGFGGKL